MAPKTIQRIWVAVMNPLMVAAAAQRRSIPQPTMPATSATSHATGIARVAGQNSPTINTAMATSGESAMSISTRLAIDTHHRANGSRFVFDRPRVERPR